MAGKREKPEEIVSKLRQVEVLQGQGSTTAEAVRQIGVTQQTIYRWRKLYGGMQRSQLTRLKELDDLDQENRFQRPETEEPRDLRVQDCERRRFVIAPVADFLIVWSAVRPSSFG